MPCPIYLIFLNKLLIIKEMRLCLTKVLCNMECNFAWHVVVSMLNLEKFEP